VILTRFTSRFSPLCLPCGTPHPARSHGRAKLLHRWRPIGPPRGWSWALRTPQEPGPTPRPLRETGSMTRARLPLRKPTGPWP